jgi:DNA-binding MarR family transcriptional regulator
MPESRLTEQALQLSRLTRDLSRCCQAKEEQLFGKFELSTAEGRVLLTVADGGPSTASALAEKLGLARSRLSPLVDSLVRKEFLSRVELTTDRRVHTLSLTPSGQRIAQEVTAYQISFHESLLRRFKNTERRELLETLDLLHTAIEDQRGKLNTQSA